MTLLSTTERGNWCVTSSHPLGGYRGCVLLIRLDQLTDEEYALRNRCNINIDLLAAEMSASQRWRKLTSPHLVGLFHNIYDAHERSNREMVLIKSLEILVYISQNYKGALVEQVSADFFPSKQVKKVKNINEQITMNCATSASFETLAREQGIHYPTFNRIFKAIYVDFPYQYPKKLRMNLAAEKIIETDRSTMKKISALTLALILAFSLVGCGAANPTGETSPGSTLEGTPEGTPGGDTDMTLRLGAAYDFKTFWEACTLVGDPLVGMDENCNPTPWLIAAWEVNEDATEYVLHMQEGVTYSDGSVFNAEICKHDIEVLGEAYYCNYMHTMERLDIADEYTLKATFNTTDLNFLQELIKIPGMQMDSLDENGSFSNHVGTGPFILTDYDKDVEATLVRNDNYWDQDRLPKVTQVKWIVIPDAEACDMALESNQVDVIGITENTQSVPNSSVAALSGNEQYQILNGDNRFYDAVFSVGMNWTAAPLDDIHLREAMEYAVGRETLVETVYFGVPVTCGHMMNPDFDDGSSQVEAYTYDLDQAKTILAESGYVLEDGILSKNGAPIELEYVSTTATEDIGPAVFIQSALKDVGITVGITSLDDAQAEARMTSGDYDLASGLYWLEPTVTPLTYYGIEDEYNCMGPYGGLGFGVTEELTELAQAILSAQSKEELSAAADAFWAANYEACPTIPIYARIRTAIYRAEWTEFVFRYNYHMIELSGVTRS